MFLYPGGGRDGVVKTVTKSVVNSMCRFSGVGAAIFPLFAEGDGCASSAVVAITIAS